MPTPTLTSPFLHKRGATAKVLSYAGPSGELVIDTDTSDLYVQNGSAGGVRMLKSAARVTAGSYGPASDSTLSFGSTFTVPYVTVNDDGLVTGVATKTMTMPATGSAYVLPVASNSVLGGIKVGANLSISDGVLSAVNTTYTAATTAPLSDAASASVGTSDKYAREDHVHPLLSSYPPASHTHSASDVTSGVFDAARIPSLDASKITTGTISLDRLPAAALERLVTVTDETARKALTTSSVQVGDTVKETSTGKMYRVVDDTKLTSDAGWVEYTVGSAASVPWSGVTGKPSSYTPAAHTHGNITNAGAIGSTAGVPIITGTNGVLQAGSFGSTAGTFCQGNDSRLSAFGASGTNHKAGIVPDPGATAGTAKYLREDGTWVVPPNTNTDTLMTQNVSTTDAKYPALLCPTANATANQGAKTGIFSDKMMFNPSTGELSIKGANAIRFWQTGSGKYSSFIRNDGDATYWLVTAANTPDGTWTSARPLIINNATGVCSINGNAATATQFSANKSVTLTGDVTGAASSQAGWSVATTLANSGVTAGNYGPSANASPAHSGTFSVPYITVDAKGRVTAASTKTITLPASGNTNWTTHLYAGASNGNANAATTNGNTYLIVCDNTTARDRRLIKGTGSVTVTSDANGVITINGTDNNTTYNASSWANMFGANVAVSASDINVANGATFTKTISTATTFTFSGVPSGRAATFSLILTNGGAYTVTWPSSVKWADGSAPDLTASGVDVLTFLTNNGGTTWYGVASSIGAA